MHRLDNRFLTRLATRLAGLPPPVQNLDRSQSWMTAPEIASWWKRETGRDAPVELDAALLTGWEDDERFSELRIRPAKYPSFDLLRMWGHESVVGPRSREEIAQRRTTPPSRFEDLSCSPDAELVFLSHSILDREFALRLRRALAECGLRPWLAEEDIEEGDPIFESVRDALLGSRATIVALGRNALGSAWVHTETVGSGERLFVCDGNDAELMDLLASWKPPQRFDEVNYDDALLAPLKAAYRQAWDTREPVQATLEGSAGGTSIRKQRPDKFHITAKELLFGLDPCQLCVYPSRPPRWEGNPELQDFDYRIERFLRS